MSTRSSGSERSDSSLDSFDESCSDFHEEFEETPRTPESTTLSPTIDDVDEGAYQDEPIASAEWIAEYNDSQKKIAELESELQKRLSGELPTSDWCSCGNCDIGFLQNLSECYCCTELDGCMESLESDLVRQEIPDDARLTCVTQHPGFQPVCLQKWSLRMAADRFKTKSNQRYRQTGSEERFLRSIAYREFSRLVHGFLGVKRIPLPACAYCAIRAEFPVIDTNVENYTGFVLEEES